MRFQIWLMNEEEDIIKKALSLDEPEVNSDYDVSIVADNLKILRIAIGKQTEIVGGIKDEEKLKAARAILTDLNDKEEKWSNWREEIEPKGPGPDTDTTVIEPKDKENDKDKE